MKSLLLLATWLLTFAIAYSAADTVKQYVIQMFMKSEAEYTHRSAGIFYCVCFDRACTEGRIFNTGRRYQQVRRPPCDWMVQSFLWRGSGICERNYCDIPFYCLPFTFVSTLVSNRNIMKSVPDQFFASVYGRKTIR